MTSTELKFSFMFERSNKNKIINYLFMFINILINVLAIIDDYSSYYTVVLILFNVLGINIY